LKGSELKGFACFSDLSDEERDVFADAVNELELEAGEEIFREGDEADGLVLLVHGRLRLERRAEGLSGMIGPGAALGALSLVGAGRREVSAFADVPCRVLWLPRRAFHRVAEDSPRAAFRFIEHVLTELVAMVRPGLARLLDGAVDPPRRAQ
jgi:CRP-like cAMP-binding protein